MCTIVHTVICSIIGVAVVCFGALFIAGVVIVAASADDVGTAAKSVGGVMCACCGFAIAAGQ